MIVKMILLRKKASSPELNTQLVLLSVHRMSDICEKEETWTPQKEVSRQFTFWICIRIYSIYLHGAMWRLCYKSPNEKKVSTRKFIDH